ALIAFSAIKNNDRVGLLTFTDRVENFIPPKKGKKHVLRVIREILAPEVEGRRTNLPQALEYLTRVSRKRSVAFVISDFMDENFEQSLKIANRRHEVIPVVIIDPMEERLPDIGIVHFEDPETGEIIPVDTSSRAVRQAFEARMAAVHSARQKLFQRLKMDSLTIHTERDHIEPVVQYFKKRARGGAR
ncbi:MAG: DUF58 domain-containing protein, partial [Bradymonadaceae bacterium]